MKTENESEKCEILTDIVAEMRTRSREVKEAFGERPDGVENMLDIWADRIEAAWNREKAEIEDDALAVGGLVESARKHERESVTSSHAMTSSHAIGNAAAMHEALIKIHDKVNNLDEECGVDPVEIRDLARAALSATAPTTEKSSAVGNAAAMYKALCDIVMLTMKVGYSIHGDVACGIIASKAKHALSAQPRNCDRFNDAESARQAWLDDTENWDEFGSPELDLHEWLFANAKPEAKGENDGR